MSNLIYLNSKIAIEKLCSNNLIKDYKYRKIEYIRNKKEKPSEFIKNSCINSKEENIMNSIIVCGNKILNNYNIDDFINEISGKNHKIITYAKYNNKKCYSYARIKLKNFSYQDKIDINNIIQNNICDQSIDPLISIKLEKYIIKCVFVKGVWGLPIKWGYDIFI